MANHTSLLVNSKPDSLVEDFTYEALGSEDEEIRLLVISAGKGEDPIECGLQRVSLMKSGNYESLSYAWGEPNFTHSILLNGAAFRVTENLWQALRHLRLEDRALVLWVDAICIDQHNIAERSQQVGLMGQIFRGCSQVYVWLGIPTYNPAPPDKTPHHDSSSVETLREKPERIRRRSADWETNCTGELYSVDPFTLSRHFAADKHFTELPGFLYSETESKHYFEDNKEFWRLWKVYFHSLETPWWSRLWCVQEVLLARSVLVVYGTWRIPWTLVQSSQVNHRRHVEGCCAEAVKQLRHRYRNAREEELIAHVQRPDTHKKLFDNLDKLLRLYSHRRCKDPRDKVYGLLGLTTGAVRCELAPDYEKDTTEVYVDTARAIHLQHPGSLRFLTGFRMRSHDFKLPSWVQDYAPCQEPWMASCERRRLDLYELYSAAGDACAKVKITNLRMKLKGIRVGTVCKVGEVRRAGFVRFKSTFEEWLNILDAKCQQSIDSLLSRRFKMFWRTLIADAALTPGRQWRRATDCDIEYFSRVVTSFISISGLTDSDLDIKVVELLFFTTYGKAMFITVEGNLGLCYEGTRPGDELWVLNGSNTPFVLRRNADGNDDNGRPRYCLIGDAYLDGYMDGEAGRGSGNLCEIYLE